MVSNRDNESISDVELLEYIAGRLPRQRHEALEVLVAQDESLRRRLERLGATWDALGRWEVSTAQRDIALEVLGRLDRSWPAPRAPLSWGAVLRVAASWLIALAAGIGGGRWFAGPAPTPSADQQAVVVEDEDVAESLYLGVLGSGEVTGLAQSLLEAGDEANEGMQ